jgi:hypothetical protein
MSISFAMNYTPAYQRRYGKCEVCEQGIEAGERIMIGTGYFHHCFFKNHSHYECWIKEIGRKASDWYFANPYKPTAMPKEMAAELNRLRVKRRYIAKKGVGQNEVMIKLDEIDKQIAMVKNGNESK